MLKLKDIKEHFNCISCINLDKHYNIYSKIRDGKRSNSLYLGYISVNNGKTTHYPTGAIVSDIEELYKIANEWADNAEYEVTTYNPDCRKSYVAEIRIHDRLKDLGFTSNYPSSNYELQLSNFCCGEKLHLFLNINDRCSDEFTISVYVVTGEYSWIDLSDNNYEKVIENIDSFLRVMLLNLICHALNVYNKVDVSELSNIDSILIKQVSNAIDVKETSFKDYLIKTLEDTLNKLKGN